MKHDFVKRLLPVALVLGSVGASHASQVIVDRSPDAISGFMDTADLYNVSSGQNFLVPFTLTTKERISSGDIYSSLFGGGAVGDPVVVKIRRDVKGRPSVRDSILRTSTISAIDSAGSSTDPIVFRVHTDFHPTTFSPGTYWFGISGVTDVVWSSDFQYPGFGGAWQLSGDHLDLNLQYGFNDMVALPFRIEGTPVTGAVAAAVPEPGAWALMLVGLGALGLVLRAGRRTGAAEA